MSDLFSLAKAMPSSSDQASLLLELDLLARKSGVTIAGVSMQEAAPLAGGSTAVPVGKKSVIVGPVARICSPSIPRSAHSRGSSSRSSTRSRSRA